MLALLLHLTLAATFAVHPAVADHFVCSYKPGGGSPVQYGYHEYCHAGIIDHINSTDVAIYGCDPGFIGGLNTQVADWGFLKRKTLELGQCESGQLRPRS